MNRGLEATLLEAQLGGLGSHGRLGGGQPMFNGGMRLGMALGGSRTPSLHSRDHLDRRSRPYHYQPPQVEDYEGMLDEEFLADVLEMNQRRHDVPGADLYGLPPGYLEELMGERGFQL